MSKAKTGFFWASSCRGCEMSMLEKGVKLVGMSKSADIIF